MSKTLIRFVPVALLVGGLLASGCSSCQEAGLPGAPAGKGGRLPQPPQAARATAAPAEPESDDSESSDLRCAVVGAASNDDHGKAPFTVEFTAEGMCTAGEGKFSWDFGDGSPASSEQNPTHTYTTPGTYTAKVTLTDPENNVSDADEFPITVTAP